MTTIELPLLPAACAGWGVPDIKLVQAYARAAIEQDRARRGDDFVVSFRGEDDGRITILQHGIASWIFDPAKAKAGVMAWERVESNASPQPSIDPADRERAKELLAQADSSGGMFTRSMEEEAAALLRKAYL